VDFWQTVRVVGRRWYIAVPVFLVVLGVAGLIAVQTPHDYESTGTVVLTEPDPAAAAADRSLGHNDVANPLLSFADSLSTDSELLAQSLNSPDAVQALRARGGTASYTASDGKLNGPFIVVVADARDPGPAQGTVALALRYVREQLVARQKALGAPVASYIVVKDVVTPTTPAPKLGGRSRFLGTMLVIAVAASLCCTYGFDRYRRRRTRARAAVA
jgi:hypothetical protein